MGWAKRHEILRGMLEENTATASKRWQEQRASATSGSSLLWVFMAASKREELKRRVEQNLDELLVPLYGLLRHAHKYRSLRPHVEDISQEAFVSLLTQIDKGNLDWVADKPDPDETIKRLLFTIFLREAIAKVLKQLKDPCSHGHWEIIEEILAPDANEDLEKRITASLDFERFLAVLPERYRQIAHWTLEEGRWYCRRLLKAFREIARLPEEQQRILRLFYIERKSQAEIAEEMHSTKDAVKQRLRRIIEKLRRRLQGEDEGEDTL